MIPFSPPDIYPEIIEEVVDTLKSGWITTGPKTKLFEKQLAAYCDVPAVLGLNSATAGLELMLRWYGVKEGDEVIVPAYTYCASANVIVHCGATPVMVDVQEDFNIDPEKIRAAITPKTKVIIPVDFAGLPCDYQAINALVREPEFKKMFEPSTEIQKKLGRILVLADAAHSFGAIYKGQLSGKLTDVSVFSFHAVKNLTTAEGGGVALNLPGFDNEEVYKYLCVKSLHGQNKDALAKTQRGNWKYDIIEAGFKWNMTDIQASIGMVGLKYYNERTLKRRREIFDRYHMYFSKQSWAQVPEYHTNEFTSSYHLYPLRIKGATEAQRDAIIQAIFQRDVSVNVHFPPLPMLSVYKNMGYREEDFPIAMDNYRREISLPVYYNLTNEMVDTVINAVSEAVAEVEQHVV